MTVLERMFEGRDLLIPKEAIESLGVKPGEYVVIRPKMNLHPAEFRRAREEMWKSL
ncbi:MAG: hypothetical protein ACUVV0_09005 [Anaerolineae bacterium]